MKIIIVLRITRPPAEALASGGFGLKYTASCQLAVQAGSLRYLATLGDGLDGLSRYAVAD